MLPATPQTICFLTLTLVGLLGGGMLGIALSQHTAQHLNAECWTMRQNYSDRLFRGVMPFMFIATLLSSIAASVVLHNAARNWMIVSCFASVLVVVITAALEVPLNNMFSRWKPGEIPKDWQSLRDAWLRNHWLRAYCGIASFLFAIAGSLHHA